MNVCVNGLARDIPKEITVESLLCQLGFTDSFVAVAINNECVSRRDFSKTKVQENDKVEILAPMSGG